MLAAAAAFYVPALHATHGDWPAPLDDVFIHYDFARSLAEGHPFEWIAGQGYSSGETSPLYAVVLAFGYASGFRGLWLGVWAALVAAMSLVDVTRSLRRLVMPAPWWVGWLAAPLVVAVGVLDWTWFSGMETALLGAAMARALLAVKRAREAPPHSRRAAQWSVGAWGAVMVLLRPESAAVVAFAGVVVARRAGAGSALLALLRVWVPGAAATTAILGMNLFFTGEAQSAGALLKLLSSNPHLSDVDRARELVTNLAYAYWKVLGTYLAVAPKLWPVLPSLGVAGLLSHKWRGLTTLCLASAVVWALLVSWNGAARFQNFRYYMPPLALVLFASVLGLAALSKSRWRARAGAGLAALGMASAVPRIPAQIRFFQAASENVRDQQVEVGRRLAPRMGERDRVLIGDAGAIPYVSGRHAIDALGLGGYREMPFARAAVLGEAATLELIERLPPGERPDFLALYPNWFPGITGTFGRKVDEVSLERNVICGGVTKGIYVADWSALSVADEADPRFTDAVDVGDVTSEREHAYEAPGASFTAFDVKSEGPRARLFDGGRVVPEGASERFVVRRGTSGPASVLIRTGDTSGAVRVRIARRGSPRADALFTAAPSVPGAWSVLRADVAEIGQGDQVTLSAERGALVDYHAWLAETVTLPATGDGQEAALPASGTRP